MSQPTVCAIMLVNGREAMVRRAIKSFREQTYHVSLRTLVVYDTGDAPYSEPTCGPQRYHWGASAESRSIGALRNAANACRTPYMRPDIICHWDSDDWSHPRRIEEQVALLQSSGKQCVGYRDMLFWKQNALQSYASKHPDDCRCGTCGPGQRTVVVGEHDLGSAWLYSDALTCLGASLCYWREVWERRPFPDLPKAKGGSGEDVEWLRGVDSVGVTSMQDPQDIRPVKHHIPQGYGPRMVASIHGGNTQYYGSDLLEKSTSWKRAPEWDGWCREKMAL